MTRQVTATLFSSVDGVVEAPHTFQFDSFDEVLGGLMTTGIARIDDVVLGRTTYQEWADYWPSQAPEEDEGFAAFINPVPKHVVSRSLSQSDLAWENSRLVEGDLHDHVRRLRETEGGEIGVTGSISVVQQLFGAGLLDRLTLIVHPVVAGQGRRLFEPGHDTTRLELVDSVVSPAGNAVLTYTRKDG